MERLSQKNRFDCVFRERGRALWALVMSRKRQAMRFSCSEVSLVMHFFGCRITKQNQVKSIQMINIWYRFSFHEN